MKCEACGREYQTNECVGCGHIQTAPSSRMVESIVRNMWNHLDDGYNQWDSLGQDEKDTLFKIAVANSAIGGK